MSAVRLETAAVPDGLVVVAVGQPLKNEFILHDGKLQPWHSGAAAQIIVKADDEHIIGPYSPLCDEWPIYKKFHKPKLFIYTFKAECDAHVENIKRLSNLDGCGYIISIEEK